MYKNFFGLKNAPFQFNPDPHYLYWTNATHEAWSALTYGIESRKGFVLLTGEVGTGKTTLLNSVLEWLRERSIAAAFVCNSQMSSADELFDFMLADFGIVCESRVKSQRVLKLRKWLLEQCRAGRATVLIIDEAQNLSEELLEEIRLLSNLETPSEKLLQIVLSGQPELEEKLKRPSLRQLLQRIVFRCRIGPLTQHETLEYIQERLRIAGASDATVFSKEAAQAIHRYAKGVPRVVNLLCEHSLINAFAMDSKPVLPETVAEVAREFGLGEFASAITPASRSNPGKDSSSRADLRDPYAYLRP
jgi:general secretion pathway protein A